MTAMLLLLTEEEMRVTYARSLECVGVHGEIKCLCCFCKVVPRGFKDIC